MAQQRVCQWHPNPTSLRRLREQRKWNIQKQPRSQSRLLDSSSFSAVYTLQPVYALERVRIRRRLCWYWEIHKKPPATLLYLNDMCIPSFFPRLDATSLFKVLTSLHQLPMRRHISIHTSRHEIKINPSPAHPHYSQTQSPQKPPAHSPTQPKP